MSTRAVYTFIDERDRHSVYKHHDGYPTWALKFIEAALTRAWPLPRFEADEFAAAFVAANKDQAGGVRLCHGPEDNGGLAYRYEVTCRNGALLVKVFNFTTSQDRPVFEGTLADAKKWAAEP